MYKCFKYLKKVFLKFKNLNIYSKLVKLFIKIMPKKQILKYVRVLYFKDNKKWKFIKNLIKKNKNNFDKFKYNYFFIKFFSKYIKNV